MKNLIFIVVAICAFGAFADETVKLRADLVIMRCEEIRGVTSCFAKAGMSSPDTLVLVGTESAMSGYYEFNSTIEGLDFKAKLFVSKTKGTDNEYSYSISPALAARTTGSTNAVPIQYLGTSQVSDMKNVNFMMWEGKTESVGEITLRPMIVVQKAQ